MDSQKRLDDLFRQQKNSVNVNASYDVRSHNLSTLKQVILKHKDQIAKAVEEDFGCRNHYETFLCELLPSIKSINYILKQLKKWMKPEKRKVHLLFQPAQNKIMYQPKGVVGIIVPWNYPIYLSIGPIAYALAAGNKVMVKMSESTPETGKILAEIFDQAFSDKLVQIINGDAKVASDFSKLPFDHLLFTGSTQIGKLVMQSASENLTPVTLELGGKSPVIIDEKVNIKAIARKIAFGKLVNSGQTCIAPDYVLCHISQENKLIKALSLAVKKLYPKFSTNSEYTNIINESQYKRLIGYINDAKSKGAKTHELSQSKSKKNNAEPKFCQIKPIALTNLNDDMLIMQNEIFGPLLPIITYKNINEAILYVNERPKPLALYFFGHDKKTQQQVLNNTTSGGVTINDTLMHIVQDDLPFGGIGPSGIGHYHGIEGYKTFSHARSIHYKSKLNFGGLIQPPYGGFIQRFIIKKFIK
ncbi:MAG: coniferyl-aldehyde dehydrogenase [Francisellaceae bacterium]|jgi:coniferyl-aldehyde dehydrogenase